MRMSGIEGEVEATRIEACRRIVGERASPVKDGERSERRKA